MQFILKILLGVVVDAAVSGLIKFLLKRAF